jgi:trans-L-3-hydroxyproline dehydratase
MLEPRGHADMYGALLTEAVTEDAHAGILFMHNEGWSTMCGHGIIAVTTVAIDRGLITAGSDEIRFDTPAGRVVARAHRSARAPASGVTSVSFVNVPSFVFEGGLPVVAGGRTLRVDVAFGGAFYAIVDSEAAGIPVRQDRLTDLRRAGMAIKHAVEALVRVRHPEEPGLHGVYGTIFTGPPSAEGADLRNVTVFAEAEVDRSPCGTGTCAVMAVLSAMGLLGREQTFTHESIIGTLFRGRVVGETTVGGHPAIVPEVEGSASITGEHTFLIDERDALRFGFRL